MTLVVVSTHARQSKQFVSLAQKSVFMAIKFDFPM